MIIALGLADSGLEAFAAERGAQICVQWGLSWQHRLLQELNGGQAQVFWWLKDIDVWGGVLRAAREDGGATDWELLSFKSNESWWSFTSWWDESGEVRNPFENEG